MTVVELQDSTEKAHDRQLALWHGYVCSLDYFDSPSDPYLYFSREVTCFQILRSNFPAALEKQNRVQDLPFGPI